MWTWSRYDVEMFSTSQTLISHQWILLIKSPSCGDLMAFLLLVWTSCWTNNRVGADLRCHDALFKKCDIWTHHSMDYYLEHLLWNCPRWMLQNPIDDMSTLVQVMAWCLLATSHCLGQCWRISFGITWHHMWHHLVTTSNGSWCMGIKGEMSGTVCVTFTWYMYIYELFIAFVCFVVCSLL